MEWKGLDSSFIWRKLRGAAREQSAQPGVDLVRHGPPRGVLRSRPEGFLASVVQFQPLEDEHGSQEFQIAHLPIDLK